MKFSKIFQDMKLYVIIIVVPLFCINISLVQYYFVNQQQKELNKSEPVFEDLIITEISAQSEDKELSEEWGNPDIDVLHTLHIALKSQLSKIDNSPKIIEPKINEQYNVSEMEIQNSVHAALAFNQSGKTEKALKIIEHAATIAPNDPDILNYYGEILEITENDIITADQLYFKALLFCPDHVRALENRERTVHVVEQLDSIMLKTIDNKREILKNIPDSDTVFQKFKKQAYYLHIYHTVGIEGNTMSIEQLRYLLETGKAVFGKSIIEHNEILGLQLAMKYVKLLTRTKKIELKEILGIHRRVMGHVDPLAAGYFRDTQVYVGSHVPPTPDQVEHLMLEFTEWLNSEEAASMHPVRYAALTHYKFVDIHPFMDGNGRTSRLLMNLILIRAGYPPVIILKEHRHQYYDYLKVANKGDVRPFVRFIAQCTEQVLDLYLWGAQKFSETPNLEDFSENTISV